MDEPEWLACTQPRQMLAYLRGKRFNISNKGRRKLRLFGCACCRRVWRLIDEAGRQWVERAERIADGAASLSRDEHIQLNEILGASDGQNPNDLARLAAYFTLATNVLIAAGAGDSGVHALGMEAWKPSRDVEASRHAETAERAAQSYLARDIFGSVFCAIALDRSWLAWNYGAIRKMAEVMYTDRAYDRLPLLADALEDAGCTDADILAHCRGPGPHVRGCWVVDLLTGRA